MNSMAILTDVTRCIGCEECVAACQNANQTGCDAPYRWQRGATALSSNRWTVIEEVETDHYVRVHCRHCLDPSCAAACPVGALKPSGKGPVVYDADICMGCRYCMMACPFGFTRYEWDSAVPRVRKCYMCYENIIDGKMKEPACTAICPEKATIFGERDQLLAEARKRIKDNPGLYVNRIWGEKELGGTSVLYISDVDLSTAGWPANIDERTRPILARKVLHTVPYTFVGVAALMYGVNWTFERRLAVKRQEEAMKNDDAQNNSEMDGSNEE